MRSGEGPSLEVDFRRAIEVLRAKASDLRRFGAEAQAAAVEACLAELETWFEGWLEEELTVAEAASEAGLSRSAAEKRLASGRWPNAGRRYRPRIRRRHVHEVRAVDEGAKTGDRSADADDLIDDVLSSYDDVTCDH